MKDTEGSEIGMNQSVLFQERKEKVEPNSKTPAFSEGNGYPLLLEREKRKKEIFEKIHIRNFVSAYATWIKTELNM